MLKLHEYKFSIHKLTFCLLLLMLITLTACADKESSKDATSEKGNEEKQTANIDDQFSQLEVDFDAEIGVYAMDTGTNQAIEYQSEERFAFASTYKALAAAIILKQKSIEELNEVITYTVSVKYRPPSNINWAM